MNYATPEALRAAIEDRLRVRAGEGSTSISRSRKLIAFDRFLARLTTDAPDQWILKGGVALDYRLGDRARATRDLDLARGDDQAGARRALMRAIEVVLDDGFRFVADMLPAESGDEPGAVRYRIRAELAGRLFETIAVDIGISRELPVAPDLVTGPDLLGFAGIRPVTVPTLPLEFHVAEKLHAYTRTYAGNRVTTRPRDLVDIVLIGSTSRLQFGPLAAAIASTFSHRGTHVPPASLPLPPTEWLTPYRALALEVGIDPDPRSGHRSASSLLDPVLRSRSGPSSTWDPGRAEWVADGP